MIMFRTINVNTTTEQLTVFITTSRRIKDASNMGITTSMNETGVELFRMISSPKEHFLLTDRRNLVKEGLKRLHLRAPLPSEQSIK
jgi:predicted aconitase